MRRIPDLLEAIKIWFLYANEIFATDGLLRNRTKFFVLPFRRKINQNPRHYTVLVVKDLYRLLGP